VSQINKNASFNKEKLGKFCRIFMKSLERKDRNVIEVFGYRSKNISWKKQKFHFRLCNNR